MFEVLRIATLIAATVTMGLLAGLFYAFAIAVMPGLRQSEDRTFVDAMRQINVAIRNPWFLLSFAGAPVLTVLSGALHLDGDAGGALPWIMAGFGLYVASLIVTAGFNIPLNNALDSAGAPGQAAGSGQVRRAFEKKWVRWNTVRTATSTAALACLVVALVVSG